MKESDLLLWKDIFDVEVFIENDFILDFWFFGFVLGIESWGCYFLCCGYL